MRTDTAFAFTGLCFLMALTPARAAAPLQWTLKGGGLFSYVEDSYTLQESGELTYRSIGAFPPNYSRPSAIGEFRATLAPKQYRELLKKLTPATQRSLAAASTTLVPLPPHTLSYSGPGLETGTTLSLNSPEGKVWNATLQALRTHARAKPVRALALSCSRETTSVLCRLQNIGSAPLQTTKRFDDAFCVNRSGVFKRLEWAVPEPSPQDLLALTPGEDYEFKVPLPCDHRLVLRTLSARSHYPDGQVLLGELVSNSF